MKKNKKTICIDFDGVLHDYSDGYQGLDVFGDMIPNADKGTQVLKEKGWTIIIYTTRKKTEALEKWLKDNGIAYDYINENPEQPEDSKGGKLIADIYLDDRGITFRGEWDEWIIHEIVEFQAHQGCNMKKKMEQAYKRAEKNIFEMAKLAN